MKPEPIVSVCMITYGHENFIEQAIRGVLMQECNFEIELILANDCSPDKTDALIQGILKSHPRATIINYFKHEKNIGMIPNFIFGMKQCKGKYIAMCEGDDYWTDPLKLQKQVDFLESNSEYAICFHQVNILRNGIVINDTISKGVAQKTTINDLAKGNYIHTCSVVYRNNLFAEFPEYFKEAPVGDYFLHLLNARYGAIKYMDESMGIYRIHGSSTWSSKTQEEQVLLWVPFLQKIKPNFSKDVQNIINIQIANYFKATINKNLNWYAKKIKFKIIRIFRF